MDIITLGKQMSDSSTTGVVDPDCKVHGVENLFVASAIPSFFRGPKCNARLALRGDDARMTSPELRVRGSELSRQRSRHAQCGTLRTLLSPHIRAKKPRNHAVLEMRGFLRIEAAQSIVTRRQSDPG